MNEGHSSLLTLELLDEEAQRAGRAAPNRDDVQTVREKCVFTTHTPVAAGHDQFPMALVHQILGRQEVEEMKDVFCCGDVLNMTFLALNLSHYVNGVAKKHGEVSRLMFAGYNIDAITNGVHASTWAAAPMALPLRPLHSRLAAGQLQPALCDGHPQAGDLAGPRGGEETLIHYVNPKPTPEWTRICSPSASRAARRPTSGRIFCSTDIERLKAIAGRRGGLQIVYAGKAHPQDEAGKEQIQ